MKLLLGKNDGKKLEQIQKWLNYGVSDVPVACTSCIILASHSDSGKFKTSAFLCFCIVVLLRFFV